MYSVNSVHSNDIYTHIAANHPVSLSVLANNVDSVDKTSEACVFLSRRVCPSRLVARQLRAKHAFLLAPASLHTNMRANVEIWKKQQKQMYIQSWVECCSRTPELTFSVMKGIDLLSQLQIKHKAQRQIIVNGNSDVSWVWAYMGKCAHLPFPRAQVVHIGLELYSKEVCPSNYERNPLYNTQGKVKCIDTFFPSKYLHRQS